MAKKSLGSYAAQLTRKSVSGSAATGSVGSVGYDNPRENIDPHIKTKAINAKEIISENVKATTYSFTTGGLTIGIDSGTNMEFKAIEYIFNPFSGGDMTFDGSQLDVDGELDLHGRAVIDDTMIVSSGSITDSAGTITFGDDNIKTSGNMAIGTTSPHATPQLHVWKGNAGTDPTWVSNDHILIEHETAGVMQFFTSTAGAYYLEWSDTTRLRGAFGYLHSSDSFSWWTAGSEKMTMSSTGVLKNTKQIEVEGTSTSLILDQNSSSGVFIDFQGSSGAGYCCPISTIQGSGSVVGPKAPSGSPNNGWAFSKMVHVQLNGCGDYYIPVYVEDSNP